MPVCGVVGKDILGSYPNKPIKSLHPGNYSHPCLKGLPKSTLSLHHIDQASIERTGTIPRRRRLRGSPETPTSITSCINIVIIFCVLSVTLCGLPIRISYEQLDQWKNLLACIKEKKLEPLRRRITVKRPLKVNLTSFFSCADGSFLTAFSFR